MSELKGQYMSDLRQAVDTMNTRPDISADDSPRLKDLCRVTATEIKAVGGVSAATSLEMIGYIRELERSRISEVPSLY